MPDTEQQPAPTALRIGSIDLIRGAVMILMAIDHVRVYSGIPAGYAWSLPLLYLVWATAILILYFPCRWYSGIKAVGRRWWLGYL